MHDVAPVTSGVNEEVELSRHGKAGDMTFRDRNAQQEQIVRKWSRLWRSIILSSLDRTVFPYSRYIRALNFRDLRYLLEDSKFKGDIARSFKGNIPSIECSWLTNVGNSLRMTSPSSTSKWGEETKKETRKHLDGSMF